MKLTPPTTATWLIAVVVGVLGILFHEHVVRFRLGIDSFWLVAAAFLLLALAALVRGL
jgi:hypothetical protein